MAMATPVPMTMQEQGIRLRRQPLSTLPLPLDHMEQFLQLESRLCKLEPVKHIPLLQVLDTEWPL